MLDGGTKTPLDVPEDAKLSFMHSAGTRGDTLLLALRSALVVDGRTYPAGALLASDFQAYRDGQRRFDVLFEPTPTRSLAGYTTTRTHVIVNVLDNVASRLEEWKRGAKGFTRREVAAPFPGTLGVTSLNDPMRHRDALAERYLLNYADFLTPDSLLLGRTGSDARTALKALPATFDASGMQARAVLRDQRRRHARALLRRRAARRPRTTARTRPCSTATAASRSRCTPGTRRGFGIAWLERGGVLRAWPTSAAAASSVPRGTRPAMKEKQAERASTTSSRWPRTWSRARSRRPKHLGIEGGSNGGLLVGAVLRAAARPVQRRRLPGAAAGHAALSQAAGRRELDGRVRQSRRPGRVGLHHDGTALPEPRAGRDATRRCCSRPRRATTACTRATRARWSRACSPRGTRCYYYENIEGGHGGAADNEQRALVQALEFSYLWQQLGP